MNGITIEFHIKKVRFEEIRSRFCAFSVMIKKIYISKSIKKKLYTFKYCDILEKSLWFIGSADRSGCHIKHVIMCYWECCYSRAFTWYCGQGTQLRLIHFKYGNFRITIFLYGIRCE